MPRMAKRKNIMDDILAEPIRLIGCPNIIVTRWFAYQFLKGCGWNPSERGFASLDWIVFGPAPVDLPLTDAEWRDAALASIREHYIREELAA